MASKKMATWILFTTFAVSSTLAGSFYKIFTDKTALPLLSTSVVGATLRTLTSVSKGQCLSDCSADDQCKAAIYEASTATCNILVHYVDDTSAVYFSTTTSVGKVVYSKIASDDDNDNNGHDFEMNRLHGRVFGDQICQTEKELGIVSNTLPTSAYSSSGHCNPQAKPYFARIDAYTYSWCGCSASTSWWQVDLGGMHWITKFKHSGAIGGTAFIAQFRMEYSVDPVPVHWKTFSASNGSDYVTYIF